jgi:hypothetical protein
LGLASLPVVVVIAGVVVAAVVSGALAEVSADMAKVGSVAFGNGTVILPVLKQDALAHHWVTLSQFGAGAFVAVRVWRLPTLVVFVAGLGIWAAYLAAGGPR